MGSELDSSLRSNDVHSFTRFVCIDLPHLLHFTLQYWVTSVWHRRKVMTRCHCCSIKGKESVLSSQNMTLFPVLSNFVPHTIPKVFKISCGWWKFGQNKPTTSQWAEIGWCQSHGQATNERPSPSRLRIGQMTKPSLGIDNRTAGMPLALKISLSEFRDVYCPATARPCLSAKSFPLPTSLS